MARNINLTGHLGPQGFISLFEALGLELIEQETNIREQGLTFRQTENRWILAASTVTVQLHHILVETGSPSEVKEDSLWASVHLHEPEDIGDADDC